MLARGVPVLETERLLLREQRLDDFTRHAAMLGDGEVMRHVGGKALSAEEAWRNLLSSAGLWPLLGYGYWSVERKSDGAYVGQVGFADYKRDMVPSIGGIPEMGWLLTPDVHGHGFASEAVSAGLSWIDKALPGAEVTAIIAPDNAPSIKVAEKAGFSQREDATYHGDPILLFRRPPR